MWTDVIKFFICINVSHGAWTGKRYYHFMMYWEFVHTVQYVS